MNNSERFARRLSGLEKRLRDMESTPQLAYSSIEDGSISEYDENGNLVSRIGKQHDGTHGSAPLDGPIPPTPVAPTAEGGQASITITYDGRYEDDRRAPLDLHVIEVYAAEEPFTQRTEAHLVGSLPDEAGGTFTFRRPPGVWYVGLVAKSVPGRRSPVSELASAEATSVVDPAIMAELEDRLGTAETEIDAANEWLDTSGVELGNRMDEAFGRIEDVEGAATSAQTAAESAQTAAQSAADAAASAQSTAEAAEAEALAAAGIAAEKGAVLFRDEAPTGDEANSANLWVRKTDSKVHVFDSATGQWVPATDPEITAAAQEAADALSEAQAAAQAASAAQSEAEAAAQAAAAAQSAADDAASAAGTAQGTADAAIIAASTAQDAADGKPLMLFDSGTPSGTAPKGSVWWQRDAQNNVIGQWQQTGEGVNDTWTRQDVSSEAIANLDVGKLTAGSAVIDDAVIAVLWADVVRAGFLGADEAIIGGAVLKDDAVQAKHIVASESMWAKVLGAHQITADEIDVVDLSADSAFIAELEAAIVKADMFEGEEFFGGTFTGPLIRTGLTAPRVEIDADGVAILHPSTAGGGGEEEVGRFGSSDGSDFFSVPGATISSDGEGSFEAVHSAADATVLGRPLVGDFESFELPNEGNATGWLDRFPRGVVAFGYTSLQGRGGFTGEYAIAELSFEAIPGRMYRITTTPVVIHWTGTTFGALRLRNGGSSAPTFSSPTLQLWRMRNALRGDLSNFYWSGSINWVGRCNIGGGADGKGELRAGLNRIMISLDDAEVSSAAGDDQSLMAIMVEDLGIDTPSTAVMRRDVTGNEPTPPPSTKTYTREFSATWFQSYDNNGSSRYSPYGSGAAKDHPIQGYTPYWPSGGIQTSKIGFNDSSIRSYLSGADVKKVELYVRADHWHSASGGVLRIHRHGNSSDPSSYTTGSEPHIMDVSFNRGQGKWITLPSSIGSWLKSGTVRGFGFDPRGSTSTTYYGYLYWSSYRPKLRITYDK